MSPKAAPGTMANPYVQTYPDGLTYYYYRDDLGTWWMEFQRPDGTGSLYFTEANPSFDSAGAPKWVDMNWHEVGPGTDYPDKEPMGSISQAEQGGNPPPLYESAPRPPDDFDPNAPPLYESDQRPADGFDPNAPPLYESDYPSPAGFDPSEVGGVPTTPGDDGGGIPGLGVPYQDLIPFSPMVQNPATGEWRNAEPGEIPGLGEGDDEGQLPPGTQTPETEPPLQPGGDGGNIGVPYQDYIPFYPMVQDPTTGEWRNAEPGELDGPQSGDPNTPGSPQMLSNLLDPSAPGPTLDPALFNPSAPGPTLDPRLLLDPDSPGPTIDPALLDLGAPGPTLDPALLDPNKPGPTVDPNLLDPSAPGETIDPALLDPGAPGPTLDPEQIEQHGIAEPSGGVAEPPADFTYPSPTDSPDLTDPATTGEDVQDQYIKDIVDFVEGF